MDLNKTILVGNIVRDARAGEAKTGRQFAAFDVATNFFWKDKDGKSKNLADYHKVVAWGKLAEMTKDFLKKGQKVYIDGRLKNRVWEDDKKQKHYVTEVVAEDVIVINKKNGKEEAVPSKDVETEEYEAEVKEELLEVV